MRVGEIERGGDDKADERDDDPGNRFLIDQHRDHSFPRLQTRVPMSEMRRVASSPSGSIASHFQGTFRTMSNGSFRATSASAPIRPLLLVPPSRVSSEPSPAPVRVSGLTVGSCKGRGMNLGSGPPPVS